MAAQGLDALEGGQQYRKLLSEDYPSVSEEKNLASVSHIFKKQAEKVMRDVYVPYIECGACVLHYEETETAYALVYWRQHAIEPYRVVPSFTYLSRDGEARLMGQSYANFKTVMAGLEEKGEMAEMAERALLKALQDKVVNIEIRYPDGLTPDELKKQRLDCLDENRVSISLFVFYSYMLSTYFSPHTHPAHQRLHKFLFKGDEALICNLQHSTAFKAKDEITHFSSPSYFMVEKRTPLMVRPLLCAGDLKFSLWREQYIAHNCLRLSTSGIARSFTFQAPPSICHTPSEEFYELEPMRRLYHLSAIGSAATSQLFEARKTVAPHVDDERFAEVDARTQSAARYAESRVVVTAFSLVQRSYMAGNTFEHYWYWMRASRKYSSAPEFETRLRPDISLFEVCYAAYAMQLRLPAVHGDLHLNNITLHPQASHIWKFVGQEEPWRFFVLSRRGERDTYAVPLNPQGLIPVIIDFSRAVLGPEARADLAADFGEPYAAAFFRDQVGSVLALLHQHAPGYAERHQDELRGAALSRAEETYAALSAVDFLAVGRRAALLFEELEVEQAAAAARNLERHASDVLLERLALLAKNAAAPTELAGREIFERAFPHWHFQAFAESDRVGRAYPADVCYACAPWQSERKAAGYYPPPADPAAQRLVEEARRSVRSGDVPAVARWEGAPRV
jgi:hypothetical protein